MIKAKPTQVNPKRITSHQASNPRNDNASRFFSKLYAIEVIPFTSILTKNSSLMIT
jgi:hypothetical protein